MDETLKKDRSHALTAIALTGINPGEWLKNELGVWWDMDEMHMQKGKVMSTCSRCLGNGLTWGEGEICEYCDGKGWIE